jgi:NADPH:quinone reductase-like Zn-dependent oxidoreductase
VNSSAELEVHALWITGPQRSEVRSERLAPLRLGNVRVRALFSGISRGSEALVYRHAVPPSERERMRAPHQVGTLPGPIKYGYSNVGEIVAGSSALLGRRVFCLYPHQTAYDVPENAVIPLPEGLPPERAVLGANMETALNALWDAAPLIGQRIVVVGAGVVGALCAYLAARLPGTEVCLVDRLPERAALAAAFGARFALPSAAPGGADLVIHASGSAEGLALALSLAADEATVLELSWYGDQQISLPLGAAFHAGRLRLQSSQVGRVAPAMRGRRTHAERLALALLLLRDPVLDHLVSGECELEGLPAQLPVLFGAASTLCQRVRYS